MIRHQKCLRVEPGKSWIAQRVGHLPEILITEPQRQAQRRRRQPGVLEKVSLVELVRIENSRAKILLRLTRRSAEVVQEVGEGGIARRVPVGKLPQEQRSGTLGCQLLQEFYAVAKGMASAQLRLRLLEQQIVCLLAPEGIRHNSWCANDAV